MKKYFRPIFEKQIFLFGSDLSYILQKFAEIFEKSRENYCVTGLQKNFFHIASLVTQELEKQGYYVRTIFVCIVHSDILWKKSQNFPKHVVLASMVYQRALRRLSPQTTLVYRIRCPYTQFMQFSCFSARIWMSCLIY